jgi:hypothetical protein
MKSTGFEVNEAVGLIDSLPIRRVGEGDFICQDFTTEDQSPRETLPNNISDSFRKTCLNREEFTHTPSTFGLRCSGSTESGDLEKCRQGIWGF